MRCWTSTQGIFALRGFVGSVLVLLLIPQSTGALLCSVVGGKMSEGINFKVLKSSSWLDLISVTGRAGPLCGDGWSSLSRRAHARDEGEGRILGQAASCITGQGWLSSFRAHCGSFARSHTKSRRSAFAKTVHSLVSPHTPTQEYIENTCMRSVNQSIGRAIRHKGFSSTCM
jgi:chromosome transmission fidelity protein 1